MERKYKVIMLLILVISIVALVLTSSYALFSFEEKGKIENKLVTGVYSSCSYEDGTTWNFDYTGGEQTFTVPCDGEYKLETWGAQGADVTSEYIGGYGGYSFGTTNFDNSTQLYINVGGQGGKYSYVLNTASTANGGYNGGGYGYVSPSSWAYRYLYAGGGATHLALSSGILSTLKEKQNDILLVASGGGSASAQYDRAGSYYSNTIGGSGGGITGNPLTLVSRYWICGTETADSFYSTGGTQTGGGSFVSCNSALNFTVDFFGQGYVEKASIDVGAAFWGGGGGFYGGSSGAGGSGYIGNLSLTDKAMYCYNCQESSEESTKTVSTTCTSQTPTENCAKHGNGYARVTLVKADKPIKKYTEAILNGTDPVLKGNLIPVKVATDGTVSKADTSSEWYSYANKEWANAIILKDETKIYNNGDTIPENNIESYFVWIPRYKYQIFDEGNYTGLTGIQNKTQTINVIFENKDTTPSNGTTKGTWLTHPAFTSFDSNGFWVGKFETGYDGAASTAAAQVNSVDTSKIIIKPNVYSWRYITAGNMFKNSYDYNRNLDSHMMKNTEWGSVAYLQHSVYGSQASVRINNNEAYITGYASTTEPTIGPTSSSIDGNRRESTALGSDGTYTLNYLNSNSSVASTTGNRTGIYDMSGGSRECVAGYTTGATTVGGTSKITSLYSNFFNDSTYTKYWDKYTSTTTTQFNNRILGDATGEVGPFNNLNNYVCGSWYYDYAEFVFTTDSWFDRGGGSNYGIGGGILAFDNTAGSTYTAVTYRIVLTP